MGYDLEITIYTTDATERKFYFRATTASSMLTRGVKVLGRFGFGGTPKDPIAWDPGRSDRRFTIDGKITGPNRARAVLEAKAMIAAVKAWYGVAGVKTLSWRGKTYGGAITEFTLKEIEGQPATVEFQLKFAEGRVITL